MEFVIIVGVIIAFILWNSRSSQGDSKPSWLAHLEELESEPLVIELRQEVEELTKENKKLLEQVRELEREAIYNEERLDRYERKYGVD